MATTPRGNGPRAVGGDGRAGDAGAGDGVIVGVDDLTLDLTGLHQIEGAQVGRVVAVAGDGDGGLDGGVLRVAGRDAEAARARSFTTNAPSASVRAWRAPEEVKRVTSTPATRSRPSRAVTWPRPSMPSLMTSVILGVALATTWTSGAFPGRTRVKRRGRPTASWSSQSPPSPVKSVRRSASAASSESARTSTRSRG